MENNNNLILGIVIAVAGFLLLGMFGFGGMWIFGFLFMTLILIALILFILWLIKQLQNDNRKR